MSERIADRLVTINVDVQNDFCPGGALAVNEGNEVIPPLNELNNFTREHGGIVIATGDQHPPVTPHFDTWPVHCVAGTEGAALRSDLNIQDKDVIINKGMGQTDGYSGLEGIASDGRTIEAIIYPKEREHVAVLIGGLATDYCVLNTTLDTLRVAQKVREERVGKITVFVIRDAIRAVNLQAGDGARALQEMKDAGAEIVDSPEILTEQAIAFAR